MIEGNGVDTVLVYQRVTDKTPVEASFPCTGALGEARQAVCRSHILAGLDRSIALAYARARKRSDGGAATLQSLAITPEMATASVGGTVALKVIGTYSDGTMIDSRRLFVPFAGPLSDTGLLSASGHGAWKRTGNRKYAARFKTVVQKAPPVTATSFGDIVGYDTVDLTLELDAGGRTVAISNPHANSGVASFQSNGWTTAFTSSPKSSFGTPMTATSATRGWVIRRFSASCG